jgi:hypothetical protein
MADVTTSKKERLRALEGRLREKREVMFEIGAILLEIRADELYKADGFDSWESYLKDRIRQEFGVERAQAYNLIACAQIRQKLPEPPGVSTAVDTPPRWSQKAVLEFGRLAPQNKNADGQPRDYGRLDRRDCQRVAEKVAGHCAQTGEQPTASVVRKFVNEELGINPPAKAAETRRRNQEAYEQHKAFMNATEVPVTDDDRGILPGRVTRYLTALKEVREELGPINDDAWTLFGKENAYLVRLFAEEVGRLADIARKMQECAADKPRPRKVLPDAQSKPPEPHQMLQDRRPGPGAAPGTPED